MRSRQPAPAPAFVQGPAPGHLQRMPAGSHGFPMGENVGGPPFQQPPMMDGGGGGFHRGMEEPGMHGPPGAGRVNPPFTDGRYGSASHGHQTGSQRPRGGKGQGPKRWVTIDGSDHSNSDESVERSAGRCTSLRLAQQPLPTCLRFLLLLVHTVPYCPCCPTSRVRACCGRDT